MTENPASAVGAQLTNPAEFFMQSGLDDNRNMIGRLG